MFVTCRIRVQYPYIVLTTQLFHIFVQVSTEILEYLLTIAQFSTHRHHHRITSDQTRAISSVPKRAVYLVCVAMSSTDDWEFSFGFNLLSTPERYARPIPHCVKFWTHRTSSSSHCCLTLFSINDLFKPILSRLKSSRLRARLNTLYSIRKNAFLLNDIRPTTDDYEAFKKANPEQGERLTLVQKQNAIASKLISTDSFPRIWNLLVLDFSASIPAAL